MKVDVDLNVRHCFHEQDRDDRAKLDAFEDIAEVRAALKNPLSLLYSLNLLVQALRRLKSRIWKTRPRA